MTPRSVVLSSYEAFVASQNDFSEAEDRAARLLMFPYPVMLELSYPELDFANRWCWQRFGPEYGECNQAASEYCACKIADSHCHLGDWNVVLVCKNRLRFRIL